MKKAIRVLCLTLALTLLCGSGCAEIFKTGLPVTSEPVTLTALVAMNPNVGDWNGHPATEFFEELTGIHVEWDCVADANFVEKRNMLFAGNTLPDMIIRSKLSATNEAKYAANGQLYPLDELLDYAPYLSAIFEAHPEIKKNITAADGHIYCFPQLRDTTEGCIANNYWINQTWLNNLGLEMPTTLDELTEVLYRFVNDDPNGNGEKDEIGFAGNGKSSIAEVFNRFYGAFGIGKNNGVIDSYFEVDDDGNVRLAAVTENYRQMLEWFHVLWENDLMDKDSFSQNATTVAAKANLDQVGFCSSGNNPQWLGAARVNFVQPTPLAGPNGDRYWTTVSGAVQTTGVAVITANCSNPEAAMRYIDYWYSELGTVTLRMGIEGKSYYIDENGDYQFLEYVTNNPDGLSTDEAIGKYGLYGGGNVPQYIINASDKGAAQQPDGKAAQAAVREYLIDTTKMPNLHFTEDEVILMTRYSTDLLNYVEENTVNFITGERDLAEWDSYVSQLEKMGLADYLSVYQAAFDRWLAL